MAPPSLRFQTEELRIWDIQRNSKSDEKPDSIQQMEKQLRSAGIGESGIIYIHVYPNRWVLSINIENTDRLLYQKTKYQSIACILRISPLYANL